MLKRNWALIALVYFAFAEVLSLAPVPDLSLCLIQPEYSEQSTDHDDKKYCPPFHTGVFASIDALDGFLEHHDKSVVGGFTIVLAISTIGLWLATNKLWEAGERQLKHLADTAAMELRAYISVETGVNFRQSRRNRMGFEFRPIVRNNGTTPANNVRIVSLIDVVTPIIPQNFDYTLTHWATLPMTSITTIGPKQERFHSRVMSGYLPVADLREIRRGRKVFHLWGAVFYEDVFGAAQRTNFSFIIFVGGRREATIWHNTERNNDAT